MVVPAIARNRIVAITMQKCVHKEARSAEEATRSDKARWARRLLIWVCDRSLHVRPNTIADAANSRKQLVNMLDEVLRMVVIDTAKNPVKVTLVSSNEAVVDAWTAPGAWSARRDLRSTAI